MLNRPSNALRSDAEPPSFREGLSLDRHPTLRLCVLFLVLVAPFLAVAGKLFQLQSVEQDEIVGGLEARVSESFEAIPTTDGRILMGGTVLARDAATYRLKLHYRWLEEPSDDTWLKRKAVARLNKSDRKQRDKIAAAKEQVLDEKRRLKERLIVALGLTTDEFTDKCQSIQTRVEGLVSRAEATRTERVAAAERERTAELDLLSQQQDWWQRLSTRVKQELTTPPHRTKIEPIVVLEELEYHVVVEDLPFDRVAAIVTQPTLYPGTDFEVTTRREYPQGPLAAHLIGVRKPIEAITASGPDVPSPFAASTPVRPGERAGQMGIEQSYNRWLSGRPGELRLIREADGEIVKREVVREAQVGADVELAMIEQLQRKAEELLDEAIGSRPLRWENDTLFVNNTVARPFDDTVDANGEPGAKQPTGGCILVMNVATGELLAAACAPRYDLRVLIESRPELLDRLMSDPRHPLFPRTTAMKLPPGSVFKTMTAIAALEEHQIHPDETIDCIGYLDPRDPHRHRCYKYRHYGTGHGPIALPDALARSCNIFFFTAANRLGPQALVKWSHRLGFGEPTGIDIAGEASGNVPPASVDEFIRLADFTEGASNTVDRAFEATSASVKPFKRWSQSRTIEYGIGQSDLTVTPLQIVRLMAAVANGGELVTPRVVHQVTVPHGDSPSTVEYPDGERKRIGLAPRTLHFVRAGLESVVETTRGTGYGYVRLQDVSIAGKTGTAETGTNRPDHAWFAGYVPADRPQVAFVVVLENGGSGAKAAGPLAKEVIQSLLSLGVIASGSRPQTARGQD